MNEIELVIPTHDECGEGPLWNVTEQALYWVDIEKKLYHRLHPATGVHDIVEVGELLGVLAFRQSGGLVVATDNGYSFFDPLKKKLERIGDPEADKSGTRFNDGKVDRKGRFWAGTLGDVYKNSLYRLDPDQTIHTMETGIDVSNGIGWSPDTKTMYYVDSSPALIYAYDFDLESGTIANRRVFVDHSSGPGVPDGLTVDAQGFIWTAFWGGWCLNRYDPQGKLERTIQLPVECPTSVAFGGPDLEDLYITSACMEIPLAERANRPQDGNLFCIRGLAKGLPEPLFAG
jgi:L-arabinonolactonase